jgi:hypothetical protein
VDIAVALAIPSGQLRGDGQGGGAVFCLARRNAPGTAQHAGEITFRVQATWGTLDLQTTPGFQGFRGLVSHDDGGRIASASFYSDRAGAAAANEAIDVWVRTHARLLLPHPPEVFIGKCFTYEAPDPQDASVFCAIRAWRTDSGSSTAERVRQCLTGFVREDGFRGCSAFSDETSGIVIAVTLSGAGERARHGYGLPGGTLWAVTGRVAVTARTREELRKGFW